MILTTLSIRKTNFYFEDVQKLLAELISDVTIDRWNNATKHILECEYDGTILHTYPVFKKETNQLSQVFATNDLTTFEERVYNSVEVKELLMTAKNNGWHIEIEKS